MSRKNENADPINKKTRPCVLSDRICILCLLSYYGNRAEQAGLARLMQKYEDVRGSGRGSFYDYFMLEKVDNIGSDRVLSRLYGVPLLSERNLEHCRLDDNLSTRSVSRSRCVVFLSQFRYAAANSCYCHVTIQEKLLAPEGRLSLLSMVLGILMIVKY